ncbi:MAG: hypothetical protein LBN38_02745 [Verrucomicrobiota bacterium]|nr:hypothetical protein [Verrucomicrobiota bacterium]
MSPSAFHPLLHPDAPVAASGLPPRILAVLQADGFSTLGALAKAKAPSASAWLDADTHGLLERTTAYLRAWLAGTPPSLTLSAWLALFLPPKRQEVLRLRYALETSSPSLSAHEVSLGRVGSQLHLTRERVRQLANTALRTLSQPLPAAAAEPLLRLAEQAMAGAGNALDAEGLADWADPAWGDLSPTGGFLLLARLWPERLTVYRNFFTPLPPRQVDHLEKTMRDALMQAGELMPVASLAAGIRKPAATVAGPDGVEALLLALLRHSPDTLALRDGRAGLAHRDLTLLVHEILAERGETALPVLLDALNARLYPESQKGSGTLRDLLFHDPLVRKTAPGRYDLPGGHQPTFLFPP